jgi:hypothetical protein
MAPGGDFDGDGMINGGDTLRFSFSIRNQTPNDYSAAALDTRVPRHSLHFIHDVHGANSLSDEGESIIIPNLNLLAGQSLLISFDAQPNFSDERLTLWSEPSLSDGSADVLALGDRVEARVEPSEKGNRPTTSGHIPEGPN